MLSLNEWHVWAAGPPLVVHSLDGVESEALLGGIGGARLMTGLRPARLPQNLRNCLLIRS